MKKRTLGGSANPGKVRSQVSGYHRPDPMEQFMGDLSSAINKSAKAGGSSVRVEKESPSTYRMVDKKKK